MQAITRRAWRRNKASLFGLVVIAATYLAGGFERIEHYLMDQRFNLVQRDPSGSLVIVDIDARSLVALDTWPWPRSYHATVVERLLDAGASNIALDIDFSARSTESEDRRLAAALASGKGRVLLSVFQQYVAGAESSRRVLPTFPLPILREYAALGSVSVRPWKDGLVRGLETEVTIGALKIPGLSVALAPDKRPTERIFYVDFGIRAAKLRRISFVDVMEGKFDPAEINGKTVIVGASAVELGDFAAVPHLRALPGMLLQAQAYESIVQGRAIRRSGPVVGTMLALVVFLILAWRLRYESWRRRLITVGISLAAINTFAYVMHAQYAYSLDTVPAMATILLCFVIAIVQKWRSAELRNRVYARQIRDRAQLLKELFRSSGEAILMVDAAGYVRSANPAAVRMFDYRHSRMEGLNIESAIKVAGAAFDLEENIVYQQRRSRYWQISQPFEGVGLRENAGQFWLDVVVIPVAAHVMRGGQGRRPNKDATHVLVVRDVTARKDVEQAQREAVTAAEAANSAKTQFLASMSHELRTPLNAIIGFSDIIMRERMGPLGSHRYKEYSQDINASACHLLEIVNDVLDVAKIEAGRVELALEDVNVAEVCEEALRIIAPKASAGALQIAVELGESSVTCRADRLRLKQIVLNLLSNAVKFTPAGGHIALTALALDSRELVIRIADTGIGIAEGNIPKAILPFMQIDNRLSRTYEGTGLGLTIAAMLTELHGGRLRIESTVGRGTTVSVYLLRSARVADRVQPAQAAQPGQVVHPALTRPTETPASLVA